MAFKGIAIMTTFLCIVMFIVQTLVPGFTESLLLNKSSLVQPWRFITAIFLHGGLSHLLYNSFALALFGSMLEAWIGPRRFVSVFLLTGISANFISLPFYDSALGASGAIFGVIGALIMIRPSMMVFAFGLPMPLFLAGSLWIIGDLIGLFIPSNVANLAHLGGIFFGFLFGAYYRKYIPQKPNRSNVHLDEDYIRAWEDRNLN
ncbi:rhomboid family intramembrane serine protease [Candidatus Pacearchaeota archaeon]|nr:rhomboid family intramembrane serine protease [Candidatus Pacearchaeota archaeon]